MTKRWAEREQLILDALAGIEESARPDSKAVVEATGLTEEEVSTGLRHLFDADYVTGIQVWGQEHNGYMLNIRLQERGFRASGLWPADAYDEFVRIVGEAIAREDDPEAKSRLKALLSSITGIGRDVVTTLIVDALKQVAGI